MKEKIKQIKQKLLLLALMGMMISLMGCSTLKGLFPKTPKEIAHQRHERVLRKAAQLKERCNNTRVLLSDLTKPINQRVYSVKPGEVCHD